MTVDQVIDSMDWNQVVEWMAYARLCADPRAFNTVEENLTEWARSISGRNR